MYTDELNGIVQYVIPGDCLEIMRCNAAQWLQRFDLVFADPPFNIGHGYDLYIDDLQSDDFAKWWVEVFGMLSALVKPAGVLVVNVPDAMVHLTLHAAECVDVSRIDWCIWHYKFGQCIQTDRATKFISSHTHCLIFKAPGGAHTFNAHDIQVPSDRATKYADPRTPTGERIPLDVWSVDNDGPNWGRVNGNSLERVGGHPNQLPEKYLERVIRAYTNAGEWVFDPCGGTGTTAVVAKVLGRNSISCELSAAYAADIAARLAKGAVRV